MDNVRKLLKQRLGVHVAIVGNGITGCEALLIANMADIARLEMEDLIHHISKVTSTCMLSMNELESLSTAMAPPKFDISDLTLDVLKDAANAFFNESKARKKPRYVKQQHRYASRYHGRRNR